MTAIARATQNFNKRETSTQCWPDDGPACTTSDKHQTTTLRRPTSIAIENILDFFTVKGFRRQISIKLFYEYIVIFFNISPTSNHLHPLQVENCDSSSRLVVDEDDNGKCRLERVLNYTTGIFTHLKLCLADAIHNFK